MNLKRNPPTLREFREVITVPDSLRKEATFIGVSLAKRFLNAIERCFLAPNLGNKVIRRYHCFTFQTFVQV